MRTIPGDKKIPKAVITQASSAISKPEKMTALLLEELAADSNPDLGKKKSDAAANTKKPNKQGKDIFRLRYLRFKSHELDSTIEFYRLLGMNLDFKTEQNIWVNPNAAKFMNTTNQQSGKVKSEAQKAAPVSLFKKFVIGFSFKAPGTTTNDPNDNMQLIFEKEVLASEKIEAHFKSERTLNQQESAPKEVDWQTLVELEEGHSYEYIVFYVKFVDRLAKRLASKGFKVKMKPKTISGVKMAIIKDPNNIEVRLIELTSEQLGDSTSTKKTVRKLNF